MPRSSLLSYGFCAALILAAAVFYYPKWKQSYSEATIAYDVAGYYLYLPATFIYHDLKKAEFLDSVQEKYQVQLAQGFRHPSDGFVIKYSMGQALQFLPWFALAHVLAEPLGYPADGFSRPYQAAISWGSLFIALLGLWFTRRNLLEYFSERTTALALLFLVLGTNYLNYTAFDGAMTHNWLFTAYSLLIFSTIRFYRRPSFAWAAAVGVLVGWMTLTRPTEMVSAIIPLFWGVGSGKALVERVSFFRQQWRPLGVAVLLSGSLMFLQLAYWKFVAGEWIVYSYEDQGFNWSQPHLSDVLFSYKAGWLMYSPVMFLAVIGLFAFRRQQPALSPALTAFCLLFLYITSAWNMWWYGGSLGMRAMVQSYAVWVFPLAAMINWFTAQKWRSVVLAMLALPFFWVNLWWTYQAHRPHGLFATEQMNKSIFWRGLRPGTDGREAGKLLDNAEVFSGRERRNVREIYRNDFENDTLGVTTDRPISGRKSLILNNEIQFSPEITPPPPRSSSLHRIGFGQAFLFNATTRNGTGGAWPS